MFPPESLVLAVAAHEVTALQMGECIVCLTQALTQGLVHHQCLVNSCLVISDWTAGLPCKTIVSPGVVSDFQGSK